jgi:segregation and condensation protein B
MMSEQQPPSPELIASLAPNETTPFHIVVDPESGVVSVLIGAEKMPLTTALESLLFVAESAVETAQLARLFDLPEEALRQALEQLAADLKSAGRGIRLQIQNSGYRLVSAPAAANLIENFLNLDLTTRLSGPALEALAVIAYRQPVTRAQIEAVRGVDCGGVLRSLIQRGLVVESGRLESVGRPILYNVTEQFMQHFGLTSLQELPPLEQDEAALLLKMT